MHVFSSLNLIENVQVCFTEFITEIAFLLFEIAIPRIWKSQITINTHSLHFEMKYGRRLDSVAVHQHGSCGFTDKYSCVFGTKGNINSDSILKFIIICIIYTPTPMKTVKSPIGFSIVSNLGENIMESRRMQIY